jgi:hypothetical protein
MEFLTMTSVNLTFKHDSTGDLPNAANEKIEDTPWGVPDYQTDHALGISFVSTPSHGGFVLSDTRADWLESNFPGLAPFTGDYRYWEEDCDAAVIPVAFRQYFPVEQVNASWQALQNAIPLGDDHKERFNLITKTLCGNVDKAVEAEETAESTTIQGLEGIVQLREQTIDKHERTIDALLNSLERVVMVIQRDDGPEHRENCGPYGVVFMDDEVDRRLHQANIAIENAKE